MNDDQAALQQFVQKGVTRLFPLPNLVFFPNVVQPLHVFEPRYREMMADALDDDRLLTLVLLQPGWEQDYDAKPAIHPVACLGRIVADQQLPDGRYNLLLRGIGRLRIIEELPVSKPYRVARGRALSDIASADVNLLMGLRRELAEEIVPRFANGPLREQIGELFKGELPLGTLCDVLTFALPIPIETKQGMLEELSVEERARLLLAGFRQIVGMKGAVAASLARKFPPEFSAN